MREGQDPRDYSLWVGGRARVAYRLRADAAVEDSRQG